MLCHLYKTIYIIYKVSYFYVVKILSNCKVVHIHELCVSNLFLHRVLHYALYVIDLNLGIGNGTTYSSLIRNFIQSITLFFYFLVILA